MKMGKHLRAALISLGAFLIASQAHALALSDATIQNSEGGFDNAIAKAMGKGKIKNAVIDDLPGLFAGDPWSRLDRTNIESIPFNGVNFVITADTGYRNGNWQVSWDGSTLPEYMDFVLVLKSGKKWGAFLFDPVSMIVDPQEIGGTFGISWLNKKGKIGKLRHASIFGRIGEAPPDGPDDPECPGDPSCPVDPNNPNGVPAPGSLALLGLGLGLVLMQRRRNAIAEEPKRLA